MAIDKHSETWLAVKAAAEDTIERTQRKLEDAGYDLGATQFLRGQINALRAVIALANPPSIPIQAEATPVY